MKNLFIVICIFLIIGCATSKNPTEYINKHPELSREIINSILTAKVGIGMTKEQVEASWGKPIRVSTNISTLGTVEMWFYDLDCLSFADGKLVMIQQI